MLNVLIGSDECSAINATINDESTPPERKAPKGTSLCIRILTDELRSDWVFSTASDSDRVVSNLKSGSQYG